jgi:hypothetical protein
VCYQEEDGDEEEDQDEPQERRYPPPPSFSTRSATPFRSKTPRSSSLSVGRRADRDAAALAALGRRRALKAPGAAGKPPTARPPSGRAAALAAADSTAPPPPPPRKKPVFEGVKFEKPTLRQSTRVRVVEAEKERTKKEQQASGRFLPSNCGSLKRCAAFRVYCVTQVSSQPRGCAGASLGCAGGGGTAAGVLEVDARDAPPARFAGNSLRVLACAVCGRGPAVGAPFGAPRSSPRASPCARP